MASMSDLYDLIILGTIGVGGYISYKNGNLQKLWDYLINVGSTGGGGGGGGGGTGNGGGGGAVGGSSVFGAGQVSLHGLASGGQQWRKEWELNKQYLNLEFIGYFYIAAGPAGETISIKLRGGPHSGSGDNATTRQGCCYILALPFGGSSSNNFQKECPHPQYDKFSVATAFNPGSIIKKWTGIRATVVNVGSGAVKISMDLDTTGLVGGKPQYKWKNWYTVTDTNGKYHKSAGGTSPPFTRSPWNGNSPRVGIRIDSNTKGGAGGYDMKFATVKEIGTSGYTQTQSYETEKGMERKPLVLESYLAQAGRLRKQAMYL